MFRAECSISKLGKLDINRTTFQRKIFVLSTGGGYGGDGGYGGGRGGKYSLT